MRIVHDTDKSEHKARMFLAPLVLIIALLAGWAIIADWHQLPSAFQTTMAQLP